MNQATWQPLETLAKRSERSGIWLECAGKCDKTKCKVCKSYKKLCLGRCAVQAFFKKQTHSFLNNHMMYEFEDYSFVGFKV